MSSIVGMTYLIYGATCEKRKDYINDVINNAKSHYSSIEVNFVEADKSSIGISEIRNLIQRSQVSSLSSQHRFFIISDANKLTEQAQNALLKLYEEKHLHSTHILELQSYSMLLPTIISRSVLVNVSNSDKNATINKLIDVREFPYVDDYRKMKLPELFKLCEEYSKDRSVAVDFVSYLLFIVADTLRNIRGNEQKKLILYSEFLLQSNEWLSDTNANARLILENCILGWWNNVN